jgi:hypothetical protein
MRCASERGLGETAEQKLRDYGFAGPPAAFLFGCRTKLDLLGAPMQIEAAVAEAIFARSVELGRRRS